MSLARGRCPLVHEDRNADSVLGLAVPEGNYGKKRSCILRAARNLSGCMRMRSSVPVGDHRLGVIGQEASNSFLPVYASIWV
jgi:hypothetical protein